MKKWSQYFQNPAFLELTRMNLIRDEFRPLVQQWCGIREGMRVLDVGCGTGYFTRFLGEGSLSLEMTGLEYDDVLLQAAGETETSVSRYRYLQGDALALPFEEGSFDTVVSHTFLTSVANPKKAMQEMVRVCKPGGKIASVTAMSLTNMMQSKGHYPADCKWVKPLREMEAELLQTYYSINPITGYLQGIRPEEVPYFFHLCGLKNVSVYPIGKVFSYSDASLSGEDRARYCALLYASEEQKLREYQKLPEFTAVFPDEKAERYLSLLREKCDYLEENDRDNGIWEITGGANMLTVGEPPIWKAFSFLTKENKKP